MNVVIKITADYAENGADLHLVCRNITLQYPQLVLSVTKLENEPETGLELELQGECYGEMPAISVTVACNGTTLNNTRISISEV